jgi:hypothetical protein
MNLLRNSFVGQASAFSTHFQNLHASSPISCPLCLWFNVCFSKTTTTTTENKKRFPHCGSLPLLNSNSNHLTPTHNHNMTIMMNEVQEPAQSMPAPKNNTGESLLRCVAYLIQNRKQKMFLFSSSNITPLPISTQ